MNLVTRYGINNSYNIHSEKMRRFKLFEIFCAKIYVDTKKSI